MTVGELIAKFRQEKGLSQDELAHLLGYKSRTTIYKIEKGQREVPRKMIAQLSVVLNVSPLDLLGENDNNNSAPVEVDKSALVDMLNNFSFEELQRMSTLTKNVAAQVVDYIDYLISKR